MKEEWKVITEFPNYEISNLGQVRNTKNNRILKLYLSKDTGKYKAKLFRNDKTYATRQVHKLVAVYWLGWKPNNSEIIKHLSKDISDNTVNNLEIVHCSGLISKIRKANGKNTSQYIGVSLHQCFNKGVPSVVRWLAHISIDGKVRHLGCFTTEEDAARAYQEAAQKRYE